MLSCNDPDSPHYHAMKVECLTEQFATRFDDDASKLENWQKLCRELSIDPAPPSITQCKKVSMPIDVMSPYIDHSRLSRGYQ